MTPNPTAVTRRAVLKAAGLEVAALSAAAGSPSAQSSSGKIPFSLIVDDGSPVDPLFYEIPG